jgi:hypothetical protein
MQRMFIRVGGVAAGVLAAVAVSGAARPAVSVAQAQAARSAGAGPVTGLAQGWSVVPSPNRSGENQFLGVSCVSATACTAVGSFGRPVHTLIESWNGANWSIVPSPNSGSGHNQLNGVSCVSPTDCTAAGYSSNPEADAKTLIESWNGTKWSIAPSPNAATTNELWGVSCVSATDCTAAGYSASAAVGFETLIESWNGTQWSIVPSPNEGSTNVLSGVSCVSATHCIAVGVRTRTGKTLVESWNGTNWSIVPSPNNGRAGGDLSAVSCVSPTDCTAVGNSTNAVGGDETLIESWNGAKWSIVPSPNKAAATNSLFGVSCVSASDCIGAGNYAKASAGTARTLIESWNGTKWSIVPSPNKPNTNNILNAVSCLSAAGCDAAGSFAFGKTLVESSNGSTG